MTLRASYWAGLAGVTATVAPLCLFLLFLVPDFVSLVSFRFLFPLSCFPCSSFLFLFPAVEQRGSVRHQGTDQPCPLVLALLVNYCAFVTAQNPFPSTELQSLSIL